MSSQAIQLSMRIKYLFDQHVCGERLVFFGQVEHLRESEAKVDLHRRAVVLHGSNGRVVVADEMVDQHVLLCVLVAANAADVQADCLKRYENEI